MKEVYVGNALTRIPCPSCHGGAETPHILLNHSHSPVAWCQICFRARFISDDEYSRLIAEIPKRA